ncbi:hypothetical protein TVAG_272440 [Trichomonas vaginalis G3]|uniref:Uncharacterized protein n=2 Tax=Trichomonas vaginalis (strain ATCC PRA-98 / G3) TaxID=412133 RepID=A2FDW0_TRIV3|nr:hypothetical protein TVAGG3_0728930 [Trichomonas vaginalis G3]EAX96916.1 hypothetical protein TVAG_272440 [Trichomonas vaginalis G3]KAI5511104.1 hypothetical protein TVAGG3_0728930 [Trichomonas vaginalis G3]|eukprot:XP_001309846.1 hypothetical protein [Trichomonas vaginalis G3]
MSTLQECLYQSFSNSKDNQISNNPTKVKPYVYNAMQILDSNMKLKLDNQQKLNKIYEICDKYKSIGNKRKLPSKLPNCSTNNNVNEDLSQHEVVYNEIMERIQQSILMGVDELGLTMKLSSELQKESINLEEQEIQDEHALSSDDEDPTPRNAAKIASMIKNDANNEEEDHENYSPKVKLPSPMQYDTNKNEEDKDEDSYDEEESDDDVFVEETTPTNIVHRK